MRNLPIGVFDSGIGGLFVLEKLIKAFPLESFVYLGDNNNVPYGNKSEQEISKLTLYNIKRLVERGVKAIVLACNTASLNLKEEGCFDIPIFKLNPILDLQSNLLKRGCFLGTVSTVKKLCEDSRVKTMKNVCFLPLENLAKNIERMLLYGEKCVFRDHLVTTNENYDFLYLGCTHYLCLKDELKGFFNVETVLDGVDSMMENLFNYLEKYDLFSKSKQTVSFLGECDGLNERVFCSLFKENE